MNEVRKFVGIADEKDRRVVSHQIPIPVLCVELERETSHVPFCVGSAALTCDRREAQKKICFLPDLSEDLCSGKSGDVACDRERAERGRAFGVDHALRNSLSVEVCVLFEKHVVHSEQWPPGTSS